VASKNTFTNRLKREITASPKKAAVLAIVCVVAIGFWTPLVLKWAGKKSTADDPVVASSEEETTSATPITAAPPTEANNSANNATTAAQRANWQKILKWIRNDPKMKPQVAISRRDPFAPAVSHQVVKVQEPAQAPPPPPPEITPQQAGIFVSSTVVGSKSRTALINGRTYRESQQIAGAKSQDRFVLVEIRPKGVILERNGQRYEVKIPRVESVQFDE
jgi:hypothetical protein